ncbi:hypothetical protein TGGT1_319520 [Toxoplasma gondii GT1]|uniref:Uncharacterized protein n=2 Tax=Toxoplasma gondii TaxID=5811 RepID=S7UK53_TOXGG|nr:hypothetical protein TGGT1_319520 [Toxoplasma gondii GT1]KAF4644944.1 hypothetical protein TGRH88_007590 [Toxoplasma gondii]
MANALEPTGGISPVNAHKAEECVVQKEFSSLPRKTGETDNSAAEPPLATTLGCALQRSSTSPHCGLSASSPSPALPSSSPSSPATSSLSSVSSVSSSSSLFADPVPRRPRTSPLECPGAPPGSLKCSEASTSSPNSSRPVRRTRGALSEAASPSSAATLCAASSHLTAPAREAPPPSQASLPLCAVSLASERSPSVSQAPEASAEAPSPSMPPSRLSSPSVSSASQNTAAKRRRIQPSPECPSLIPKEDLSLPPASISSSLPLPPAEEEPQAPKLASASTGADEAGDAKGARQAKNDATGMNAPAGRASVLLPSPASSPPLSAAVLAPKVSIVSRSSRHQSWIGTCAEENAGALKTETAPGPGTSAETVPPIGGLLDAATERLARSRAEQKDERDGEAQGRKMVDEETTQHFLLQLREQILGATSVSRSPSSLPTAASAPSAPQASAPVEGALAQAVETRGACGEEARKPEVEEPLRLQASRRSADDDVAASPQEPPFLTVAQLLQELAKRQHEASGSTSHQTREPSRPVCLPPQLQAPAAESRAAPLRLGAEISHEREHAESATRSSPALPSRSLLQACPGTTGGSIGGVEGVPGAAGASGASLETPGAFSRLPLDAKSSAAEGEAQAQPLAHQGPFPAQPWHSGNPTSAAKALSTGGESWALSPTLDNLRLNVKRASTAIHGTEYSGSDRFSRLVQGAQGSGTQLTLDTGSVSTEETLQEIEREARRSLVREPLNKATAAGPPQASIRPASTSSQGSKVSGAGGAHAGRKGEGGRGGKKETGGEEGDRGQQKGRGCCRKGHRDEGEGDKRGRAPGRDSKRESSERSRPGEGACSAMSPGQANAEGEESRLQVGETKKEKASRLASRPGVSGAPYASTRPRGSSKTQPKKELHHTPAAATDSLPPRCSRGAASDGLSTKAGTDKQDAACEVSPQAFPCCRRRLFCLHDIVGLFAGGAGVPSEKLLGDAPPLFPHTAVMAATLSQPRSAPTASSALLHALRSLASPVEAKPERQGCEDAKRPGGVQMAHATHLVPRDFVALNERRKGEMRSPKLVDLLHAGHSGDGEESARENRAVRRPSEGEKTRRTEAELEAQRDKFEGNAPEGETRCDSDSDDWEDEFSVAWLDSDDEAERPLETLRADVCGGLRTFFYFLHEAVEALRPQLLQAYRDHFAFLSSATKVSHLRNYEAILSRLKRRSPCRWTRLNIQMTFAELEALRELHSHRQSTCKALLGHAALSTLFSPLSSGPFPGERPACVDACLLPFSGFFPSPSALAACTFSPFSLSTPGSSSSPAPQTAASASRLASSASSASAASAAKTFLASPASRQPTGASAGDLAAGAPAKDLEKLQEAERQSSLAALRSLAATLKAAAAASLQGLAPRVSASGATDPDADGTVAPLPGEMAPKKEKKGQFIALASAHAPATQSEKECKPAVMGS